MGRRRSQQDVWRGRRESDHMRGCESFALIVCLSFSLSLFRAALLFFTRHIHAFIVHLFVRDACMHKRRRMLLGTTMRVGWDREDAISIVHVAAVQPKRVTLHADRSRACIVMTPKEARVVYTSDGFGHMDTGMRMPQAMRWMYMLIVFLELYLTRHITCELDTTSPTHTSITTKNKEDDERST